MPILLGIFMNKLFLAALLLMYVTAHAAEQSQTLIRYSNGAVQTLPAVTADYNLTPTSTSPTLVKNAGLLYDKGTSASAITAMGGNYAFTADGSLMSVSEAGSLFTNKVSFQPAALGGNFFINKGTNEVIAIDSAGFYNSTMTIANNVRLMGGNFYIDRAGVLTTVKHMGTAPGNPLGMVTTKTGLGDFSSAIKAGGNFFLKVDGTIVGINNENGFYTDPQKVDSRPKQIGGNYFVGENKVLYTVSDLGFVTKLSPVLGKIKTYGYSYLLADDGYFIFIDGKGIAHTDLVQVSATGAGKLVNQIKAPLSTQPSFIPAQQ